MHLSIFHLDDPVGDPGLLAPPDQHHRVRPLGFGRGGLDVHACETVYRYQMTSAVTYKGGRRSESRVGRGEGGPLVGSGGREGASGWARV
jgi:hypothetical protein